MYVHCTPPFSFVFIYSPIFCHPHHSSILSRALYLSPSRPRHLSLPFTRTKSYIEAAIHIYTRFHVNGKHTNITVHSGHNLFCDGAGEWRKSQRTKCAAIFVFLSETGHTQIHPHPFIIEFWGEKNFFLFFFFEKNYYSIFVFWFFYKIINKNSIYISRIKRWGNSVWNWVMLKPKRTKYTDTVKTYLCAFHNKMIWKFFIECFTFRSR